MNFEYLQTIRKESSIDITDPGNAFIQAFNDAGEEYFLVTKTELGFVTVKVFGPFEDNKQCSNFSYYTYIMEYNEKRLYKVIDDFLNGRNAKTQVFEVTKDLIDERLDSVIL